MTLPLTTDFSWTKQPSGGGQGFLYGGATCGGGSPGGATPANFGYYFNPQRDMVMVPPSGILPEASGNTSGLLGGLGSKWVYAPTGWNAIVN